MGTETQRDDEERRDARENGKKFTGDLDDRRKKKKCPLRVETRLDNELG